MGSVGDEGGVTVEVLYEENTPETGGRLVLGREEDERVEDEEVDWDEYMYLVVAAVQRGESVLTGDDSEVKTRVFKRGAALKGRRKLRCKQQNQRALRENDRKKKKEKKAKKSVGEQRFEEREEVEPEVGGGDADRVGQYGELASMKSRMLTGCWLSKHGMRGKRWENGREKYSTVPGMNIVYVQNC